MNDGRIQPRPFNPGREALREYRILLARRDALAAEREEHYARALSCTARMRPVAVKGSGAVYDRMAEDVCRAIDSGEQLDRAIAELDAALERILRLIDHANDERGRLVLTLRYIRGMNWDSICRKMGYERTQAFAIHGRALLDINRWLLQSAD